MQAEHTRVKGSSVLFHNDVFEAIHFRFERGACVQLVDGEG